MNMAVTDGLALMPPAFAAGLGVWSRGDGLAGQDSYAGAGGGVLVPSDPDFGACLEFVKTASVQKLRFTGNTPIMPGLFLRVRARVKCLSGSLPSVRIAGWAGTSATAPLAGAILHGPATAIPAHGQVVELSAIIATAQRGGVDMVWSGASLGHVGLDVTGPNGALLRVESLVVEDVSGFFAADLIGRIDVRDFGAKGDGISDDTAAFNLVNAAANGREIIVPAGTYKLEGSVTIRNPIRFQGKIVQAFTSVFILHKNFDFPTYADAFADEETAFKKAFQALLNFSDHDGLDLCGRRIALSAPVDMQACDPSKTRFGTRRVIRNGQFQPIEGEAWTDTQVTGAATYAASNPRQLTNVANIAAIRPGSLVTGTGVGREVYVTEVNVAQARLTLSAELSDAEGRQSFTFRRFKYLLDFSGFEDLTSFVLADIDFFCEGRASGVMLAKTGTGMAFRDCFFTRPKDRGITSSAEGCQGLLIDRCQFLSNEQSLSVGQRRTIAFNANANDVKIRDNRVVLFKHFCILAGTGHVITGNHWFHGDASASGVRQPGIVLTAPNVSTLISGNYIDNNFIEWNNEHDATPDLGTQLSFGGLTITGNIFIVSNVAAWFRWLVVKPHGAGHFIHGLTICNNVFRARSGDVARIEAVDTSFADLDYGRMRNIHISANSFHGVTQEARNPMPHLHAESTPNRTWLVDAPEGLPFGGRLRVVEHLVAQGALRNGAAAPVYEMPFVETEIGAARRQARLTFATPVSGTMRVQLRMDNPL